MKNTLWYSTYLYINRAELIMAMCHNCITRVVAGNNLDIIKYIRRRTPDEFCHREHGGAHPVDKFGSRVQHLMVTLHPSTSVQTILELTYNNHNSIVFI